MEKEGLTDTLASQILERKTIDRIAEFVKFEEVPLVEEAAVETIDETAGICRRGRPAPTEEVAKENDRARPHERPAALDSAARNANPSFQGTTL